MLDKTIFAQNMAGLCEVYNRELTSTLQNIYYAILKEMQDNDFKQAIRRLLQERVFATFPKPAEILELSNVVKVEVSKVDKSEVKAQYLIDLVYAMNTKVFDSARSSGRTFDDELKGTKFLSLSTKESNILSIVKPHINIKTLVANISNYDNGSTQMRVFKQAVNISENLSYGIENVKVKKMIKQ